MSDLRPLDAESCGEDVDDLVYLVERAFWRVLRHPAQHGRLHRILEGLPPNRMLLIGTAHHQYATLFANYLQLAAPGRLTALGVQ